jgi:hypothetical protein
MNFKIKWRERVKIYFKETKKNQKLHLGNMLDCFLH